MEALQQMAAPGAIAIRDGEESQLPARELVPGDVILLKAGDKVPADCRLTEAFNLQADEAPLTGESVPIEKQSAPLPAGDLAAGDRTNISFAGTSVTYGRGRAVVVATGMNTEFGKIARMLQGVKQSRTPLQETSTALAGHWPSSRWSSLLSSWRWACGDVKKPANCHGAVAVWYRTGRRRRA